MALSTTGTTKVTAIAGDGIGPEVMEATKAVLAAAGARIEWEDMMAGAEAFKKGIQSGTPRETIDSIERTGLALKGPLETPVGYGERSANVSLRKHFELYANIRPVRELPGIRTPFSGRGIDMVVVRENVEDLYAGIEYMQTPGVAECLKLISDPGSERILRFAFALAQAEGRSKLACSTKANIMKLTEGMMKRVFERISGDYPSIAPSHLIVDNCAHQMVIAPEQFDVVVMTNMNGDILSDLAAGLVGGLGVAPSSNIGDKAAMFEAVHGSAPQIAGKNLANPTALLLSAVMLLRHIGDFAAAEKVEQSIYVTLTEGKNLTGDIAAKGTGVGTDKYVAQLIENLGRKSDKPSRDYAPISVPAWSPEQGVVAAKTKEVVGVDLFIDSALGPQAVGDKLQAAVQGSAFSLLTVANRGVQVWPPVGGHTFCVDHYRARLMLAAPIGATEGQAQIADLLGRIPEGMSWMHLEKLMRFDGKDAFSKLAGE
ncbi:NADP-dependent isocitrate dehydrogenase [Acetobacteraceae bacterium H6797]|nr:NADP-dependent isocitrate dehydrogenase [Acetobacteraceae bacterium H6797]